MPRIYLCFLWHMHQPLYKDLVTGEYRLPWTRMHALKDYYGMVKILDEFPTVHQTFNLVPSLMLQIADYASGRAVDPFLECAVKPAQDLTEAEQEFVLQYFFQSNVGRMIYRYPRYGELYDAWQKSGSNPQRARRVFNSQDIRDLQVISHVAWFDEEFQEHDPEVKALLNKGRNFSPEDQAVMARKQREIVASVLPAYKAAAQRGQIEISTTPFYHPILPLLIDSNIAATSHPGVPLPSRFRYPMDARHQLQTARQFIEHELGRAPVGLWPSEGSVSDEALAIAADTGFEWAASDNGVLAQTVRKTAGPELTYRSYLWQRDGRQIKMIFRDHFLSDLIGFDYAKLGAEEAAVHFLDRVRANANAAGGASSVLVPIILDGENAWEYYYRNGRPFLRELYRRIADSSDLQALSVSEALKLEEPRQLDHIFPGSWINANFDIWIGAQEDNRAWEYLLRARQKFDECGAGVPDDKRALAHEELMIAEGSDWCWWYGPEHQSENRREFDELFRQHLANVYHALGLAAPDELLRPILKAQTVDHQEPPTSHIKPLIDGEVTSYFEWMGAGRYQPDARSGSMHQQHLPVRDLYYGVDESYFYLRLDFVSSLELTKLELRTPAGAVPLMGNPAVEFAYRKIMEARVPLNLPEVSADRPLRFQIALSNENLTELIPPEGWIEIVDA